MSWNYSGDPKTSNKDAVRLTIGDTDSADPLLQDEEIAWLLQEENGVLEASIASAQAISAKFSRLADRTSGKVHVQASQRAAAYMKLADKLIINRMSITAVPYAGGLSVSEKQVANANTDQIKGTFSRGQMNNRGSLGPVGNNAGDIWGGGGDYNGW